VPFFFKFLQFAGDCYYCDPPFSSPMIGYPRLNASREILRSSIEEIPSVFRPSASNSGGPSDSPAAVSILGLLVLRSRVLRLKKKIEVSLLLFSLFFLFCAMPLLFEPTIPLALCVSSHSCPISLPLPPPQVFFDLGTRPR